MDTLSPADLAARVAAWHNRHPLARRIAPAQVAGLGVVSLPFALRPPRADAADPAHGALTPIFDARWMYGVDLAALDRFAARHGRYPLDAASQWPWRQVDAELARAHAADAAGLTGRTARHLLCAVIEADGRRHRVLVAPGFPLDRAAVFGRRVFNLPRLAAGMGVAAAAAAAAAAVAALGVLGTHGTHDTPASDARPAAAPDAVTRAAAGSASAAVPAAHTRTAPAATAATAGQPVDVHPMLQEGRQPLVRIRPALAEDERRQARQLAQALRSQHSAQAALLEGPAYALATPLLRTRDDAQAQQALLQGLQAQLGSALPTRLELMPVGRRWRVVWWPHPQAEEAERLRRAARARGLKLEVVAF